jgi:hypothetical protein
VTGTADIPAVRIAIAAIQAEYTQIRYAQPMLTPWAAFMEAKRRCVREVEAAALQLDVFEALNAARGRERW